MGVVQRRIIQKTPARRSGATGWIDYRHIPARQELPTTSSLGQADREEAGEAEVRAGITFVEVEALSSLQTDGPVNLIGNKGLEEPPPRGEEARRNPVVLRQ